PSDLAGLRFRLRAERSGGLQTRRSSQGERRRVANPPYDPLFSASFAASHSASISARSACAGVLPRAARARSIEAKRRSNFWLVARRTASGSASRLRARL